MPNWRQIVRWIPFVSAISVTFFMFPMALVIYLKGDQKILIEGSRLIFLIGAVFYFVALSNIPKKRAV
jgi:hypothetical protein